MSWIKVHRSKLNWEWFTEPKVAHFFEYCLLKASYNDYKWKGHTYSPGQFPFGLNKASIETGLSIQSIRTCLDKLKSTNELTIKTSRQGSVITIVNWEKFQEITNETTNQITNDQQTINKRSTTTKNINNIKNKRNIYNQVFDIEEIYNSYPKKQGKKIGIQKLNKIIKTQDEYDVILKAAKNYTQHCKVNKTDAQFIKQFSTWVNQECWNDELDNKADDWKKSFLTRTDEEIINGR